MSNGKPWSAQSLRTANVLKVREAIRQRAREGYLDFRDADHNSPNYRPGSGFSNKQITIAARIVLGLPEDAPIDYELAKEVMLELAFGPRLSEEK